MHRQYTCDSMSALSQSLMHVARMKDSRNAPTTAGEARPASPPERMAPLFQPLRRRSQCRRRYRFRRTNTARRKHFCSPVQVLYVQGLRNWHSSSRRIVEFERLSVLPAFRFKGLPDGADGRSGTCKLGYAFPIVRPPPRYLCAYKQPHVPSRKRRNELNCQSGKLLSIIGINRTSPVTGNLCAVGSTGQHFPLPPWRQYSARARPGAGNNLVRRIE